MLVLGFGRKVKRFAVKENWFTAFWNTFGCLPTDELSDQKERERERVYGAQCGVCATGNGTLERGRPRVRLSSVNLPCDSLIYRTRLFIDSPTDSLSFSLSQTRNTPQPGTELWLCSVGGGRIIACIKVQYAQSLIVRQYEATVIVIAAVVT